MSNYVCEFDTNKTAEFWQGIWAKSETGWKSFEAQKPFAVNMAKVFEAAGTPATELTGKSVFVPLCGDTYAAKFFADNGCDVVGVDIAEASLVAAQEQYFTAELGFKVEKKQVLDGTVVEYSITKTDGTPGSVRYFAGDIFAVINTAFEGTVFDIVYDRASFVAMHPSLHPQYLAMMHAVFRKDAAKKPVMFLELIVRPTASRMVGPPFHIAEPLDALYPTADGYRNKMITAPDMERIKKLENGEAPPGPPLVFGAWALWIES